MAGTPMPTWPAALPSRLLSVTFGPPRPNRLAPAAPALRSGPRTPVNTSYLAACDAKFASGGTALADPPKNVAPRRFTTGPPVTAGTTSPSVGRSVTSDTGSGAIFGAWAKCGAATSGARRPKLGFSSFGSTPVPPTEPRSPFSGVQSVGDPPRFCVDRAHPGVPAGGSDSSPNGVRMRFPTPRTALPAQVGAGVSGAAAWKLSTAAGLSSGLLLNNGNAAGAGGVVAPGGCPSGFVPVNGFGGVNAAVCAGAGGLAPGAGPAPPSASYAPDKRGGPPGVPGRAGRANGLVSPGGGATPGGCANLTIT